VAFSAQSGGETKVVLPGPFAGGSANFQLVPQQGGVQIESLVVGLAPSSASVTFAVDGSGDISLTVSNALGTYGPLLVSTEPYTQDTTPFAPQDIEIVWDASDPRSSNYDDTMWVTVNGVPAYANFSYPGNGGPGHPPSGTANPIGAPQVTELDFYVNGGLRGAVSASGTVFSNLGTQSGGGAQSTPLFGAVFPFGEIQAGGAPLA
jgi:hypothetical protein